MLIWQDTRSAFVGAPPWGEAFGFAVFLRFAARRGSYRVGGRPRGLCRSPAPGRRLLLCDVLAIHREAQRLQADAPSPAYR